MSPAPSSYVHELVVKVLERKLASMPQREVEADIEAVLQNAQEEIIADCHPFKEADDLDGVRLLLGTK